MDYSINRLTTEIVCDQTPFSDFESLKLGYIENDGDPITIFDSTEYCIASNIKYEGYRFFSRANRHYIELMAHNDIIDRKNLFYLNTNGHELINITLLPLFMMYIDVAIMLYFFSLISDLLNNGVAYSDNYIARLTMERIPNDVLQSIISIRNNGKESDQTDSV